MTRSTVALIATIALIAGCATSPKDVASPDWIEPGQAVLAAAAAPREGVTGTFVLTVKAVGRDRDHLFLNSEEDYRDPRNISIDILPDADAELTHSLGASADVALNGKRILVSGTARRTRIDFTTGNRPSGKYYYQTHVRVGRASQIQIL